jgi:hypothetical protein
MLIAFSTTPGATASYNGKDSGPYAAALAAQLIEPGLNHSDMFFEVQTKLRPILVRGLPLRGLDLDPAGSRARSIRRILALADDALEAEPRAFCQQGADVGEALAEAHQVALGTRQQRLKLRPPRSRRRVVTRTHPQAGSSPPAPVLPDQPIARPDRRSPRPSARRSSPSHFSSVRGRRGSAAAFSVRRIARAICAAWWPQRGPSSLNARSVLS